jgi:cytosine/adenosine deaminase-related metal-dependent hydrolase
VDYVADLEWLGEDVWLAHCVHIDTAEVERFGATRTGIAHCPTSNGRLGAGIAPIASLLRSGAPVGLGVDGAASNEGGELEAEAHAALVLARLRDGAGALSARDALSLATRGGAHCLGREREIGTLEPGKVADIALWSLDTLAHAGIADPVAALVMGAPRRVHHLVVDGRVIVREGKLTTVDEDVAATELDKAARRLLERATA